MPTPVLSCEADVPRLWRAGTLTYTTRGLAVLFCWLLWGDFAWSIKERSILEVLKLLLGQHHASNTLVSLLLVTLPGLLVILIGPIISYKSDRHRGRWGRRRPFLLIPTPIAAGSIILLAFAPAMGRWLDKTMGPKSIGLDQSILLFMGLFWMLFEFGTIIANTVFSAFVNDVVPKPVLGRFYGLFRAISLIVGILFMGSVFGHAKTHYVPIFIGVGLLYGIGFAAMCLKVKEGEYPPPPEDDRGPPSPIEATMTYLRDCFAKPYYYWVFAALILPALAFLPINTFNLYFSQSVGMSTARYGELQAFYFFLSLLQAVPLGWAADKFHPLRVAMFALLLHGAASLWGGFFIHDVRTFSWAYVLTGTLSGTWYTATAALALVLMPKEKFAQYFAAYGILNTVASIIFTPLMGRFLDLTHSMYRYTYLAGGILDVLGLLVTIIVYRKFLSLGGMKGYVAP